MSAFVSTSQFPNVPDLPGVPALLRAGVSAVGSLPLLEVADASGVLQMFGLSQWGVFDQNNNPVAIADSFRDFDFSGEYAISDYPVEQGGFASYNKVIRPFESRVTLTCGGAVERRTAFITALETARASLDLYSVVTPEYTYDSVNLMHVDYSRTVRSGATMIIAALWLRQVNVTGTSTLSNTKSSSGADSVNGGTVQPQTPSAQVISAASQGVN